MAATVETVRNVIGGESVEPRSERTIPLVDPETPLESLAGEDGAEAQG